MSVSVSVLCLPQATLTALETVSKAVEISERALAPVRAQAEALQKVGQALAEKLRSINALALRFAQEVKARTADTLTQLRRLWASLRRKSNGLPALYRRLVEGLVGRVVVNSPPFGTTASCISIHLGSNSPNSEQRKRSRSVSRDHRRKSDTP